MLGGGWAQASPRPLMTSRWLEGRGHLVTAISMPPTETLRVEGANYLLGVVEILASHSASSDITLAGPWTIMATADCHNITSSHLFFFHLKIFDTCMKVEKRV